MTQSTTAKKALLVEEKRATATPCSKLLSREGYDVIHATSTEDAYAALRDSHFEIVLLDLMMADGVSIDLLRKARKTAPDTPVIVVTADGSINRAVDAMRSGAFDFLVKPVSETALTSAIRSATHSVQRPAEVKEPKAPGPAPVADLHGFVGSSGTMRSVCQRLERVGRSSATVFITGERGTGKEVAARALHRISTRRSGPFIALNCANIPPQLLEAEIFGHLRGAYAGATGGSLGAARAADGGTLFIDAICEMDLALQAKLLRFLQTNAVTPVGSSDPVPVDARIICATSRNPIERVTAGRFREDLFHRLHVVPVHLPPLRERGGDILEIARHFLHLFSEQEGRQFRDFDAETQRLLNAQHWPGNVRELQGVIRTIVTEHDGPVVTASMLPGVIRFEGPGGVPLPAAPAGIAVPGKAAQDVEVAQHIARLVGVRLSVIEQSLIEATIASCGSIPEAASVLGISPSTIYRRRESRSAAVPGER